jgi:hypothetical protein
MRATVIDARRTTRDPIGTSLDARYLLGRITLIRNSEPNTSRLSNKAKTKTYAATPSS